MKGLLNTTYLHKGKLIVFCSKLYINTQYSHRHSFNTEARTSDENLCTAAHRSPLNTETKCQFDAYQISSQKAKLNIFNLVYFDTALEGNEYIIKTAVNNI